MPQGQVRVSWWVCDEQVDARQLEARRGDALLQNHLVTVAIRSPWVSLSRLDRPGGSLIDFAPVGGRDWVLEALPELSGTPTGLELLDDGVRVVGTDLTWRLDPDRPVVWMESDAQALELQGDRRHEPLGAGWYRDDQRLWTDGVVVEDTGGLLVLAQVHELWVGDRQDLHAALYDTPVSGSCPGDRVEVRLGGEVVAWLDADFEDTVPAGALLVCTAEGYEEGPEVAPGADLELSLGEGGRTWARAVSWEGQDIPAVAENAQGRWAVSPGGAWIPTPDPVTLSRGPGWSSQAGPEAVLQRLVPQDWLLADLFREAMPSVYSRVEAGDDLMMAAAEGVTFAVQAAPDEIGRPYANSWFGRWIRAEAGSWAATTDYGELLSWPHSRNARLAAHGAVAWQGLGALDLLAVARGPSPRLTVVEPAWVEAAGHPVHWQPAPDLLRMRDLSSLGLLMGLLDADAGLGVVGPATWLDVAPQPLPGVQEVERVLVEGRSVASSGPLLILEAAPGLDPTAGPVPVTVRLYAGEGRVDLRVDGALVESRLMRAGDRFTMDVEGERWALATLEGQGWAVSAPLSLR